MGSRFLLCSLTLVLLLSSYFVNAGMQLYKYCNIACPCYLEDNNFTPQFDIAVYFSWSSYGMVHVMFMTFVPTFCRCCRGHFALSTTWNKGKT